MTNHLYDALVGHQNPKSLFCAIEDGRYYSYQHVAHVSARLANRLTGLGVGPGDRVVVQIPKSVEALMLYLACVRAGAVFVPLNTAYTAGEVGHFLDDAKPSLFLCDPKNHAALEPVAVSAGAKLETMGVWTSPDVSAGSFLDGGLDAPTEFETVPRRSEDLAAILYTSGTTGRSKGAMLTHDNLLSNARSLMRLWGFTADDRLVHALPVFHTHGLFVATNIVLLAGASMTFLHGFDADAVIDALPDATSLMGVPTFYTRLLDNPRLTPEATAYMRLFVSGSAPLLEETHIAFEARTGQRILERYGMTETNMNTSNPLDGERRAGTVGLPLPDVELRICDTQTGEPVARGDVGVVEVRGPNVFPGYWQMPEKTAEEFRSDGFFVTGDLACHDPDGYVRIVGREKDLIISGGYNIYPKEIELLLDEQAGVMESAVIGVPHPDFGESVLGILVMKSGVSLDEQTMLDAIRPAIARFKQPRRLVEVETLPRNAMGKVQKAVLREQYGETFTNLSK